MAFTVWSAQWRGRGAGLLTVSIGVVGGECRSAPPLVVSWCVTVFWHVVKLMVLASGEQGSTPPSPLCSTNGMMCIINPKVHRGHGLHGVPLGLTVVCQGRGVRLRTAVMLFSVMSVVSSCRLSLS